MAEKLSVSVWTTFVKKQKLELDDKAFVKALGELDKAGDAATEPKVQALEAVVEQAGKLVPALVKRKKELGDKPFNEAKDKVHELLEQAERQLKQTRAEIAAAADEEAESPALLTTKMIPLIREIRKGESVMQALIAVAGKETVVLLSRRAISPARGKLLKEQMSNPGGLKFIRGECLLEKNAFTFVVQASAAGLAKRLRAALLAQTELRLKVRVRGEDPEDVEEDGEAEDGEGVAGGSTATNMTTETTETQPETATDPLQQRYEERLPEIEARVAVALAAGAGDTGKIRAVQAFALEKAAAKTWAAALKGLDTLQTLLDAAEAGAKDPGGATAPTGKVGLEVLRNELRTLRVKAVGGISQLAAQLAADPHPQATDIAKVVKRVALDMPGELEGLLGKLEQAMQANDAAAVASGRAAVRKSATDWMAYLQKYSQPIQGCENNPWGIAIAIDKPVRASLRAILSTSQ